MGLVCQCRPPRQWKEPDSSDDSSTKGSRSEYDDDDKSNDEVVQNNENNACNEDCNSSDEFPISSEESDSIEGNSQQFATWKDAREHITKELRNYTSDIHLITGRTKKEKCTNIWKKYAHNFEEKKAVDSIGRLLLQRDKKEGPFAASALEKEKQKQKEGPIWKTRKETSEAYSVLYNLRLHRHKGAGAERVSAEEIYKHHKIFHQYPIEDFKKWDKEMVKLTDKQRKKIDDDVRCFQSHLAKCPRQSVTSRGKLFWDNHAANNRLIEDIKSGKASKLKPKELWESHDDYQDFSLEDFRKHIYQEKYGQLAGPYWQKKQNKIALKKHLDAVDKTVNEWRHTKFQADLEDVTRGMKAKKKWSV